MKGFLGCLKEMSLTTPLGEDVLECPPAGDSDLESTFSYSPSIAPEASAPLDELGELVSGMVGTTKRKEKLGLFVEFCCQDESACCRVARHLGIPYLGITKDSSNVEDPQQLEQLLLWLQDKIQDDRGPVHLWGSLPCTKWSPWQRMAIHRYGEVYAQDLLEARQHSLGLVEKYKEVADIVLCSRRGSASFEWSRDSEGWKEEVVQQMIHALNMQLVNVDGCAFHLVIDGRRPLRPWTNPNDL